MKLAKNDSSGKFSRSTVSANIRVKAYSSSSRVVESQVKNKLLNYFSLLALAIAARENNLVCPELTNDNILKVKGGR